jgi:rare lipoprotein A
VSKGEAGRGVTLRRPVARFSVVVAFALVLAACGRGTVEDGYPTESVDVSTIPDAVPRVEPKSRYGNPPSYVVLGKRYYTLDRSDGYSERGVASTTCTP